MNRFDIIINGMAESGKDTFIKLFEEVHPGKVFNFSSVDIFRDFPYFFGWNGIKDNSYRNCLHYLKKASTYIDDFPTKYLLQKRKANWDTGGVYFYHIREEEEIKKFIGQAGFDVITLLLKRDKTTLADNPADNNVLSYSYDYTISNNGSIDDLRHEVRSFYRSIT